jgi:hypothetical protein
VREFKAYKEKEFEKGHRDGVFCLAFSPDGTRLASGSSDRSIKIWNVADGSVVLELNNPNLKPSPTPTGAMLPQAHPGWVYSLRYTADGKYLVSVGGAPQNKGFLGVWNAADGKMVYGEELPLGTFYAVAVSPDAKLVAVGTGATGRPVPDANNSYILKMPDAVK